MPSIELSRIGHSTTFKGVFPILNTLVSYTRGCAFHCVATIRILASEISPGELQLTHNWAVEHYLLLFQSFLSTPVFPSCSLLWGPSEAFKPRILISLSPLSDQTKAVVMAMLHIF